MTEHHMHKKLALVQLFLQKNMMLTCRILHWTVKYMQAHIPGELLEIITTKTVNSCRLDNFPGLCNLVYESITNHYIVF